VNPEENIIRVDRVLESFKEDVRVYFDGDKTLHKLAVIALIKDTQEMIDELTLLKKASEEELNRLTSEIVSYNLSAENWGAKQW